MRLYEAIDLHSTNNVTVVINEQDQVVYQKRLPNDLSLIAKDLGRGVVPIVFLGNQDCQGREIAARRGPIPKP